MNFIPNVSLDIPGFKKKGSEFPVVSFKFTHKMMVNFFVQHGTTMVVVTLVMFSYILLLSFFQNYIFQEYFTPHYLKI